MINKINYNCSICYRNNKILNNHIDTMNFFDAIENNFYTNDFVENENVDLFIKIHFYLKLFCDTMMNICLLFLLYLPF